MDQLKRRARSHSTEAGKGHWGGKILVRLHCWLRIHQAIGDYKQDFLKDGMKWGDTSLGNNLMKLNKKSRSDNYSDGSKMDPLVCRGATSFILGFCLTESM